jgi:hypothetical protein
MRRIVFFLASALTAWAAGPESLRVDPSGRYLMTSSGKPVFLLADTAWDLCRRLSRDDIDFYLQHRREQGFNAVAFVLVHPPATRPNWPIADYTIARTRELGFYAIVLPAWGDAFVGGYDGKNTSSIIFDSTSAAAYGRELRERYGAEKHIIWMLGGDRRAVYGDRDYRAVFRSLAEALPRGAPASFHPQKKAPQSSAWFHNDRWLTFNSIQHWPEDQVPAITADWNLTPAKPTWIFEGRDEAYYRNNYKPEQWGEWQTRFQAYQSVFAGGFGFTYGHERIFDFGAEGWAWKKELDAPGAKSMRHLASLMNSLAPADYLSRVPDQAILDGDAGKVERLRSDYLAATRSGDSRMVMVYSANGRPVRVRLARLPAGSLTAAWFDPRTGERRPAGTVAGGPQASVREFVPPGGARDGNDQVLVISTPR